MLVTRVAQCGLIPCRAAGRGLAQSNLPDSAARTSSCTLPASSTPTLRCPGQTTWPGHRQQAKLFLPKAGVEGDLSDAEANFLRRIGWVSFWAQLALTVVSAVVLSFTVSSSMQGALPNIPVLFTLGGVVGSFISTFLAYGFTRVARKVIVAGERVAKNGVLQTALNATRINLIALFLTLVGLQATVGGLVAKTLTSSTSNPYQAGAAARNAPAALDVFSVQASTNTILAHFLSLAFANWLLRKLNAGATGQFKTS